MIKFFLLLTLFTVFPASAQDEVVDVSELVNQSSTQNSEVSQVVATPEPVEEKKRVNSKTASFFNGKTKIKDPFSLRDPFRSPLQKGPKKQNIGKGIIKNGIFTNLTSIEGVSLDQIKIVGVLVGKDRRAMAMVGGNPNPVILKEGMIIGEDGAELKAILPGGIVLVEKIVNVYGEEEYLETVIPISVEQ